MSFCSALPLIMLSLGTYLNPQSKGTCSTGLETGCKPVLLYLVLKIFFVLNSLCAGFDPKSSSLLQHFEINNNYSHAWMDIFLLQKINLKQNNFNYLYLAPMLKSKLKQQLFVFFWNLLLIEHLNTGTITGL